MYQKDNVIANYRKLLESLEEDEYKIGDALEGQLLDAYRKLIREEKHTINKHMQLVQNIY